MLIFFFVFSNSIFSQNFPVGYPIFEENFRRNQLIDSSFHDLSFNFKTFPFIIDSLINIKNKNPNYIKINLVPILLTSDYNSKRPYIGRDYSMIPNRGSQFFLSGGINVKYLFFNLVFQPEFVYASNLSYFGFQEGFTNNVIRDRFHFWNFNDFPEKFGEGIYSNYNLGQSSFTFQYGSFELGFANRNIWWGPGQWNSLIFSNNAPGFPHFTFNTIKPAKTFLGYFESQILLGRLESSGFNASQSKYLNFNYFNSVPKDWRFLNGMTMSFQPKWISGLFIGFSRTFQQYNDNRGNSFLDLFPIFESFTKTKLFQNGNSVDYDAKAQDQQVSVFGRYLFKRARAEIYFEFARRDHSFNWREFFLNPEHARAYLLGFNKLVRLQSDNKFIQFRGEITHQQESVNRYIRYIGLGGFTSWHTHYQVRGFTNYGQALGVGIGTGSNVQTLEISLVDKFNKAGILLERLANHQDFFYRAFGQQNEHKPWVDLSLGFLFDHQWNNLLLSSKLQLINGLNYQWQLDPSSTPDFPRGQNLFSIHSQVSLIYLFKNKDKEKNKD
ncbi:capsule assembly Wzi family protein [Algoriphagus sp. CAU 1675]|uniref:capsule assembly Wzi family protein n=1 Tax=Algoriphagus sp. CAU 1675 TaxID=3032597 RepID=UPI0023DB3D8D|nr:capsule assembly Wzi family protein [Algoriphagus sp. CAU 1675]MDF2158186.1 capsule assembly Wzi family protein [Algoriphagus sp. CAU 1675]